MVRSLGGFKGAVYDHHLKANLDNLPQSRVDEAAA